MDFMIKTPESDLLPIFESLSEGVLIIGADGMISYRNAVMRTFPAHLEERVLQMCELQRCDKDGSLCHSKSNDAIIQRADMEGWKFSCHEFGASKLVMVNFDNKLGKRIQNLREDFSKHIRDGDIATVAAIRALRKCIGARWISIGIPDPQIGRIDFDFAYDGEKLQRYVIPPLYHREEFDCSNMLALTTDLDECFKRTDKHKHLGIGHIVGLPMKNHKEECVGYALLADEQEPQNIDEAVTLLREMAVLFGPYFEINSVELLVEQAQREANTDIVTGHGNRRALESFVKECLSEMKREQKNKDVISLFDSKAMRNSVMMLVDLDGFKRINDTMGHEAGDAALRLVADSLQDIDNGSRVFRVGGDELVQVFPRAGELEAELLRLNVNDVEKTLHAAGFRGLGLSIGVVNLFEGDGSYSSLMTLADARMYHEKHARIFLFAN